MSRAVCHYSHGCLCCALISFIDVHAIFLCAWACFRVCYGFGDHLKGPIDLNGQYVSACPVGLPVCVSVNHSVSRSVSQAVSLSVCLSVGLTSKHAPLDM